MEKETVRSYDLMAEEYDEETAFFWEKFPDSIIKEFRESVGKGRVLDLGSGPGRDGLILKEAGLDIVCLDASESMVGLTAQKGLSSILADFMNIPFSDKSFSGVWAYTSLIHIPKAKLPEALREVKRVLVDGGVLGLGFIEGETEGDSFSAGKNLPRYFAFYKKEEVESVLESVGFVPFYFEQFRPGRKNYLNFLARKVALNLQKT